VKFGHRQSRPDAAALQEPVLVGLLELQVESAACLREVICFQTAVGDCSVILDDGLADLRRVFDGQALLMERLGVSGLGLRPRDPDTSVLPLHVSDEVEAHFSASGRPVAPDSSAVFEKAGFIVGIEEYRREEHLFAVDSSVAPIASVVVITSVEHESEIHEHVRFGRTAVIETIERWAGQVAAEIERLKRTQALEAMSEIATRASSPNIVDHFSLGPTGPRMIEQSRADFDGYAEHLRRGWDLAAVCVHGLVLGHLTLLAASGPEGEEIDIAASVDRKGGFPSFREPVAEERDDGSVVCGYRFNFRQRNHWGLLTVVSRVPLSQHDHMMLSQLARSIGGMIEVAVSVNQEVVSNFIDRKTQRPNETVMFGALAQLLESERWGALVFLGFVDRLKYFESLDTLTLAGLFTATLDDINDELVEHDGRVIAGILTGSILYVLCEGSFATQAEKDEFAARLRRATSRPKVIGRQRRIQPEIAVGAVRIEPSRDVDTIVSRAYSALDHANETKSDHVEWAQQDPAIVRSKRLALEMEFKEALEHGQIVSYFQPEYSLRDGRLLSFESLVRWEHPDRGLLGPNDFIPIAEASGLIVENDLQRLRHSAATAVAWGLGERGPEMRVNLSSATLHLAGMAHRILGICDDERLARSQLVVEVTETAILRNLPLAVAQLRELRVAGVGVALDDFGVGESSLARLRSLPVSIVKLDRQFVSPLPGDRSDRAFVEAVRTMIRAIDLEITAEGVENEGQRDCLLEVGVDRAQGFLFSKPLPAEEARALLSRVDADPAGVASPSGSSV